MAAPAPVPMIRLESGKEMPAVGLGCWMGSPDPEIAKGASSSAYLALKNGYRHLDTAAGYANEGAVGEAMRRAMKEFNIPREAVFLTTKLADHLNVEKAFLDSWKALDVDYIDMYLMHWPQAQGPNGALPPNESPTYVETWQEMEKLLENHPDKVKHIGVSNFNIAKLEELAAKTKIKPATNQVESHPCLPQERLLKYCKEKGIILTAYTPLGQSSSPFFTDPVFLDIAKKHNAEVAQVLISWAVLRGTIPIPKSSNEERIIKNITLLKLSEDEMTTMSQCHKKPGMHKTLCFPQLLKREPLLLFGWKLEWLGWALNAEGDVTADDVDTSPA